MDEKMLLVTETSLESFSRKLETSLELGTSLETKIPLNYHYEKAPYHYL